MGHHRDPPAGRSHPPMSDESSANDQVGWMPQDQPEPADQEEPPARAGWMPSTRPIGPMGLRSLSRRPYIIAGVAVAALLGGAGAALAATNSPAPAAPGSAVITNPSSSAEPPGAAPPAPPRFPPFGPGPRPGGLLFRPLPLPFVMRQPAGGCPLL